MLGLLGISTFSPDLLLVTSTSDSQSAMWHGISGEVETTAVTVLSNDNLYFTTYVKIKNIGASRLNDFYCKYNIT
jgi:hypothetical protein